jgi:hypothetical protein
MAEITWEQIDAQCGDDDNITITIKELSDGLATGKEYYTKLHKDRSIEEFKQDLKKKILADREQTAKEKIFAGNLDLSDFENFITQ